MKLVKNALDRLVPNEANGKPQVPFQGVNQHHPKGRKAAPRIPSCIEYPEDGNKLVPDLEDGAGQSRYPQRHDHFHAPSLSGRRPARRAVVRRLRRAGSQGPGCGSRARRSPCHKPLIAHLESGVIRRIEGSLNGPLGDYCTDGRMRGMGVLRSHGGRYQAIQDDEVRVDIAVIAAPAADAFGNANGVLGPSACGSLNFALADSMYAGKVIVATDNLVPFPCVPWQIQGNSVDVVVKLDRIGNPAKIVSGTTQITKSPDRL